MRYLATAGFLEKVKALSTETSSQASLQALLHYIGQSQREELASTDSHIKLVAAENGVFIARIGDLRVFLSFGEDKEGEYALLLDLVAKASSGTTSTILSSKDPIRNRAINPTFNRAINPTFNRAINPTFNRAINPTFNRAINPTFNRAINPTFNRAINPTFNRAINPTFNRAINPTFNRALNPRFNFAYDGPYEFDVDNKNKGYFVRANETVLIRFDNMGNYLGTAVQRPDGGFNLFDKGSTWTGYLVPNSQGGYLVFDVNGNWNGFVV